MNLEGQEFYGRWVPGHDWAATLLEPDERLALTELASLERVRFVGFAGNVARCMVAYKTAAGGFRSESLYVPIGEIAIEEPKAPPTRSNRRG